MKVSALVAYLEAKDPDLEVVIFDGPTWSYRSVEQTATHPDKVELISGRRSHDG